MIQLDDATLRQVQLLELELLQEVDRICRKNRITYVIAAGTMLGSVRHRGFIPWDDDADVALVRSEYERFREACRTDLDSTRFVLQDHVTCPGYRWGYSKLRRKGTVYQRTNQEHMPYEQGVCIDVFPMDTVPQSFIGRRLVDVQCFCVRKLLWARVGRVDSKSRLKRMLYLLLDQLPEGKVLRCYDRMISIAKARRSDWVRVLLFPAGNRQRGYLRKWYEETKDVEFERCILSGMAHAEEYLKYKFGDYMEYPPLGQRVQHAISEIRLNCVPEEGSEQIDENED